MKAQKTIAEKSAENLIKDSPLFGKYSRVRKLGTGIRPKFDVAAMIECSRIKALCYLERTTSENIDIPVYIAESNAINARLVRSNIDNSAAIIIDAAYLALFHSIILVMLALRKDRLREASAAELCRIIINTTIRRFNIDRNEKYTGVMSTFWRNARNKYTLHLMSEVWGEIPGLTVNCWSDFVLFHELGHLLLGHCDEPGSKNFLQKLEVQQHRSKYTDIVLPEFIDDSYKFEFEADAWAIETLNNFHNGNTMSYHCVARRMVLNQKLGKNTDVLAIEVFPIFFANAIKTCFAIIELLDTFLKERNTTKSHPKSKERLANIEGHIDCSIDDLPRGEDYSVLDKEGIIGIHDTIYNFISSYAWRSEARSSNFC